MYGKTTFQKETRTRRAVNAVVRLLAVVTIGTVGFCIIEGWPAWKGLYFTLITITTVGYGDEGISESGAKFATFILVFGIALVSHAFATLVQLMVSDEFAWKRRMQKQIDALSGHTIVCGFGMMSQAACEELENSDVPFCIIEPDAKRVEEALELGYLAIEGNGTEDETLMSVGIDRASHLVAMASPEDGNIVIALTARELSSDLTIIARAASPRDERKLRRAGADIVVSPYHTGGHHVATMVARPRLASLLSVANPDRTDIALAEVFVSPGSRLIGSTITDYGRDVARNVCFVALERPGAELQIPPSGSIVVEPEDLLIVAGDPEQVASMRESATVEKREPLTV